MVQIDDHFKNSIGELSHAIYSREEVISILNKLKYNVDNQVEALIEEAVDNVKQENKNISVLDDKVMYGECKRVIKDILDEILGNESNYGISLDHENTIQIKFTGKSTNALAEEILDELNEII
jgi:hypothetical protein